MKNPQRAFTLTELLVVVAIIGVLAAIVFPSYLNHVKKSRQAEARAALVSLATVLGQYHLDKNTYVGATLGTSGIFSNQVPVSTTGGTKTYTLAITAQTATAFTISATPVDSTYTTYTLTDQGVKTPTGW